MHELIFHNISEKGVHTIHKAKVYTSLKGLYKGCVLYTGASYTREITKQLVNPGSAEPRNIRATLIDLLWVSRKYL